MRHTFPLAILCVILLITIPSVSAGDALPELPAQYFGTVTTESGATLPAGTILTAQLGGEKYTITLRNDGVFGAPGTFGEKLMISPDVIPNDKTIGFWIGSTQTKETEIYQAGVAKGISLTISLPKITIQNQNAPTINGREIFSDSPQIVCNSEIPVNFQLIINEVSAEQQEKLSPLPKNAKSILIADITPVNPPTDPYTIIHPFTLQKSDFTELGVEKTDIIVLHHTGSAWEELIPVIKKEHGNGAVDYEIYLKSFSVYLIAAKTTATNPEGGSGSGGSSSGGTSGGSGGGSGSGSNGGGSTGGGESSMVSTPQTVIPTISKTQTTGPTRQPVTTTTTVPFIQQDNEFPLLPVIIGFIAIIIVIGAVAIWRRRKQDYYY